MNKKQIVHAQKPTVWDLSNQILYNLCREHPEHTDDSIIITKIMMIGSVKPWDFGTLFCISLSRQAASLAALNLVLT